MTVGAPDPQTIAPAPRCAAVRTATGAVAGSGPVRRTGRQAFATRALAAAALRRVVAVERRLAAGLQARDLCGGGFGAAEFVAGTTFATGGGTARTAARPAPFSFGTPATRGQVRLSSRQLGATRGMVRTALRRVAILERRLGGGLTGADLAPGAVTSDALAPGLVVTSVPAAPVTARTAARAVTVPRVRVSLAAMRADHRSAVAALRRADALVAALERGVDGTAFRDGTIGAGAVRP